MNLFSRLRIPLWFKTTNLLLRRYQGKDAPRLFEAARESINEVYPFLPWCHPDYSFDDSRQWIEAVEADWKKDVCYNFAVFDHDNAFVGGCGLNRIDQHPVANLGYWTRTHAAGRGIATEAAAGLAQFGFEHLQIKRIEIVMSTRNLPSRRVAERSGATYEGLLRNRLLLHGELHDAFMYSLIHA